MTNNKLTDSQLMEIIKSAEAVISALAGTNEDVHPDNSAEMCRLYDWLNDNDAPPEVVLAMARELQERRKADSEPVAWMAVHHSEDVTDEVTYSTRQALDAFLAQAGWFPALTEIKPLYAAPQPAPDSEAQATLKRLAVIMHGSEVDLDLLTVTAQSLVDCCKAGCVMVAVCEVCGSACNNPNHPQKAVRASEAYKAR